MNYRLIAIQVGDKLKYSTSVNEIDRAASSIFKFQREDFPSTGISAARSQRIFEWVLTLAKQSMTTDERNGQLIRFLHLLAPGDAWLVVEPILAEAGVREPGGTQLTKEFVARGFHEEVHRHSRTLFGQGNYFHAVFEAAKAYNKAVQAKAQSEKDGTALMQEVWSSNGVLKLNTGQSQTERNVQDGTRFLAAGLMQALRNPTAHEPALDWPISKEDCLDMLSFITYLYRQLDKAVYFRA